MGSLRFRCALGRSGCSIDKREGDGNTPIGTWRLREAFFRADRLSRPRTGLKIRAIVQQDGWCDAPMDPNYNRLVHHPYPVSAEHLWRDDNLYDLVVVLGFNDTPPIKGRGSAIFLHCARDDYAPTQGCVAISRRDLVRLLAELDSQSLFRIGSIQGGR